MRYHIEFDIEFKKNPYPGLYVAIEGIDGSGKSTQVERLQKYFQKIQKPITTTSEPNNKLIVGKLVRDILQGTVQVPSAALQYIYTADRIMNFKTVIEPALQKGRTVISHRSFWSAVPYGLLDRMQREYSFANAKQLLIAQGILALYHQFIVPDITFFLDISTDSAMKRVNQARKTDLYDKREKIEKIAQGYKWLISEFPDKFVVINGEQPEEKITTELVNHIEKFNKK